jgi:hypothetical protein
MYGMMAPLHSAGSGRRSEQIAPVASAEFWFAIQLAMLAGFATAYPVNWLLIRKGLKEEM